MRRTWLITGLLVLAATAGPVPAGHAVPPNTLAGDTTITATTSAQADLTLANDAVFDLAFADTSNTGSTYWERRDFDLRGDGRFIAFVLRRVGDTYPVIAGARYGLCHTAGCTPVNGGFYDHIEPFDQVGRLQITLPAGAYVATVVTDGAPVTVRLRLSGVGGQSTVAATRSIDVPRWHPSFTQVGPESVVLDQTTLDVPPDSMILAGWSYMYNGADVAEAYAGYGCQHPGPAIDPVAGDYPGCAVGYATNLFQTRNVAPGVRANLLTPAGFTVGQTEPIHVTAPGPWTFSWQVDFHSSRAWWGLAIVAIPI